MFRNLSALLLMAAAAVTAAHAQKNPESAKTPEKAVQPMVWSFQTDGSYLGIEPREVTKENFGQFGLSAVRGVAVGKVFEDSPAEKAGLQKGDVIVKFNGEEITSVRKLTRLIGEVAPDHQANLSVFRGGSEREIAVTIGKRETPGFSEGKFRIEGFPEIPSLPEMPNLNLPRIEAVPPMKDGGPRVFSWTTGRQIGVSVTPLTKQLGDYFGVADGNGLLISEVREDSPAAKAGLKAGDIIVEADGKTVRSNSDLVRAVNAQKEGEVTLTVIRRKTRETIKVTPEAAKGDILIPSEGMTFERRVGALLTPRVVAGSR